MAHWVCLKKYISKPTYNMIASKWNHEKKSEALALYGRAFLNTRSIDSTCKFFCHYFKTYVGVITSSLVILQIWIATLMGPKGSTGPFRGSLVVASKEADIS